MVLFLLTIVLSSLCCILAESDSLQILTHPGLNIPGKKISVSQQLKTWDTGICDFDNIRRDWHLAKLIQLCKV